MGLVARQSFKYSLIGYFGFFIGTIASLFLFPLNMVFYGKLRYILPTAEILVPVVVFGVSYANIKFFNKNKAVKNQQHFLLISLLFVTLNFFFVFCLFWLLSFLNFSFKTSKLWEMRYFIFSIVFILAICQVLNKYISNFKRIVIPNIFENLFPKFANIAAFLLFFYFGIQEKNAFLVFLLFFVFSLISYFYYLNKLEKLNLSFKIDFLTENNYWKEIAQYSLFIFMGNMGNYLATRIDNYMIGEYIGFKENGIYSTFLSVLGLLTIPQMGLYAISAPIITKNLEEKDYISLNAFHKKTALYLFFIGISLFSCILIGFPFLANFIKNGEALLPFQSIILILGISLLFDLATGFNGSIISLSNFYKFNMVVMLFLALNTIFLNYYFITNTNLGIVGVAIATSIALFLFNVIKIIFNYIKFKVFPLSIKMLYISIVVVFGYLIISKLPNFSANFLNLVYKPCLMLLILILLNYYLKVLPFNYQMAKKFLTDLLPN